MGSVRKRGKTWNAQVRISGWRSFTKSFKSKSDALCWIKALESNLKSADIPKVNIGNITLKDLLQRYATEQLQLPPTHKSRKRRLVGNEKERLLSAACSQKNIYIAFIIEFAIETGMRRSEILKLRWFDIDFTNGFAFLFDTKNGEDRRVPLTKRCVRLLQKVPQVHEKVFPITANCLRPAWGRARAKADIKDLRFHDLRHEAISRFFEMGMTVPEVALISGHKDVRQLLRYTHLNPTNVFRKYKEF